MTDKECRDLIEKLFERKKLLLKLNQIDGEIRELEQKDKRCKVCLDTGEVLEHGVWVECKHCKK